MTCEKHNREKKNERLFCCCTTLALSVCVLIGISLCDSMHHQKCMQCKKRFPLKLPHFFSQIDSFQLSCSSSLYLSLSAFLDFVLAICDVPNFTFIQCVYCCVCMYIYCVVLMYFYFSFTQNLTTILTKLCVQIRFECDLFGLLLVLVFISFLIFIFSRFFFHLHYFNSQNYYFSTLLHI